MTMMKYGLMCAGFFWIALGLFHFPRIWTTVFAQWDAELNVLPPLSRKLINTVLVALCLLGVALGLMTIVLAGGNSHFDRPQVWFLFFCFLFWLWRTVWQILYFPVRKLNAGPGLISLHVVLIVIFVINTAAYAAPVVAALIQ